MRCRCRRARPGFPNWIHSSCICISPLGCLPWRGSVSQGCLHWGGGSPPPKPRLHSVLVLLCAPCEDKPHCTPKKLSRELGQLWASCLSCLVPAVSVLSPLLINSSLKFPWEFNPCGHRSVDPTVPITSSWDWTTSGRESLGVPLSNQFSGKWRLFFWWMIIPSVKFRGQSRLQTPRDQMPQTKVEKSLCRESIM